MNDRIEALVYKYETRAGELDTQIKEKRAAGDPTDYLAGIYDCMVATIVELKHLLPV